MADFIRPESFVILLSTMVFGSSGKKHPVMWPNDVVLDYKITIQYGVYWLCTTSISLSFEDSEKALNSDSLDVLFCLRNHSY